MRGIIPRRYDLQNPQAVVAVGNERESAPRYHPDLYIVHIVHPIVVVERLIKMWRFRIFDVDDAKTVFPRGDVGVGARDIDISCITKSDSRLFERLGMGE